MLQYSNTPLSSKLTTTTFIGSLILLPIILLIMLDYALSSEMNMNVVLFLVIMGSLAAFSLACTIYLAKGKIENNRFVFKRFFKPKKTYELEQLSSVNEYKVKRGSYILVTFTTDSGKERYLLTIANTFYAKDGDKASKILEEILNHNLKLK